MNFILEKFIRTINVKCFRLAKMKMKILSQKFVSHLSKNNHHNHEWLEGAEQKQRVIDCQFAIKVIEEILTKDLAELEMKWKQEFCNCFCLSLATNSFTSNFFSLFILSCRDFSIFGPSHDLLATNLTHILPFRCWFKVNRIFFADRGTKTIQNDNRCFSTTPTAPDFDPKLEKLFKHFPFNSSKSSKSPFDGHERTPQRSRTKQLLP